MKFQILKKLALLALVPVSFLSACGGDDPVNEESGQGSDNGTVTVSVNAESFTFNSYDGSETQELVITANKFVKAVADDDWCVLSSGTSSKAGEYVYKITPAENKKEEVRSTTIRILQVNTELKSVAVTQAAAPHIESVAACFLGLGWNFGNQLDSQNNGVSSETCWGNPAGTQATFDGVKKAGFQTVRIPVTWMGHIGEAPEYKIEEAWMNRVAEVVGYCEKAGLNAIINIHHDGSDSKYWLNIKEAATSSAKEATITEELTAIWKQIATKFQDKGEWLMFETMNEIQDGGWGYGDNTKDGGKQYAVLNRWNQACVDAIRSVGGQNTSRWIGVPGYSTNTELTLKNLVVPTDASNRIAVAVHNYDPYAFTLECSTNSYSAADMNNIKKLFAQLKETYMQRGVQCYVGEFGCVQRTTDSAESTRLKYLKEFAQAAKEAGLSIILWDNNADNGGKGGKECNAFIDHATGEYKSAKAEAATKAIVEGFN